MTLLPSSWIKYSLTRLGAFLPARAIYSLNASIGYLELGRWMRAKGYDTRQRFSRREELFDLVGQQVRDREVLYLEFGVFQGEATRHWSKLLLNPKSKLHGFDSFEGLPENWLPHRQKGYFATSGEIPQIDDNRVTFFKGWFDQTLRTYKCPPHDALVINLDADLYSSTICVLNALKNEIVRGTYIYFDEFNHRDHELRAFDEFIDETGMKFSLVGVTRTMQHALFRRDG
jgi:Macrocin-O-methyltransferase (TylF)